MPLSSAIISYDLSDLGGVALDSRRTKVWATTNVAGNTVIDTDGNEIRVGSTNGTVGTDGTGSISVWVPGAGSNPASWQTYIHVDYPDRNATTGGRGRRTFGPFTITASANLADLVDEQEVPATYISTITTELDGYVTDAANSAALAQSAADLAEAISGIDNADEAITVLDADAGSDFRIAQDARLATAVGTAVNSAKVDPYAIQRLDRRAIAKAREGGGAATIAYTDATELTADWSNLTGWQSSGNAQVSGNRLYAQTGNNPGGALRSFVVGASETAHIAGTIRWKPGGSNNATYFGLDLGTADHAPVASSIDGVFIGFTGAGAIATYKGSNLGAITTTFVQLGANPTVETDYYVSIDVLTDYVSMSMRDIANPNNLAYLFFQRSAVTSAGKAINNIAMFIQEGRALTGNSFGPIAAVKSRQPVRSKTLGGQVVEGAAHRFITTAPSVGGDPWRIQLPKSYDPRKPSPVVIWHHQSLTGDANDPWTEGRMQPLTTALANAGFIFASATDGGDRWGNAASLANYRALYEHIRDRYNTGPLFLIGVSMGFLPVLNALAFRDLPTPAGVVSIGGVCNLDLLWQQAAYDDGIATAYAISGPDAPDSEYETKTAGYNPMDRAGWEFRGVPMRFYSGSSDTVVTTAGNATAMSAKVAPYAPEATVVELSGAHLDNGHYVADLDADSALDIVEFFQAYA